MNMSYIVYASILLTVVSWGVYGPVLHLGQQAMDDTRMRPLICVGLAYFLISILVPLVAIYVFGFELDKNSLSAAHHPAAGESAEIWNSKGFWWSLAGGIAGAMGAIGIVIALSSGGNPGLVMPLVFGGAPIVTSLTNIAIRGQWGLLGERPLFFVGIVVMLTGAVLVLRNTPPPPAAGGHGAAAPAQPGETK